MKNMEQVFFRTLRCLGKSCERKVATTGAIAIVWSDLLHPHAAIF